MKKLALILIIVFTGVGCEPEPIHCDCTRTIFIRENYVETNPYEAVWVETVPCRRDDLVWVIKDVLFYTVTIKQ